MSKQLKSGRLDYKEVLQEKQKLKSSLKRSLRFYEKNMIIPSRYINKYGRCLFDNSKDEINILGLKIFVDMELSIRGTIPLEFSDKELSLIERYAIHDQKYELHSVVRLMMFLSNKIRKIEECGLEHKDVLDKILKLKEFSEKPCAGKQRYFHYRFEDNRGIIDGDISLTKLKLLLSFFN